MIIAEIGLNHQGDTSYSLDYCKKLVNTNVDAVTYQIREKEFYQKDDYKKLELTLEHYQEVGEYLHRHDKLFGVALSDHDLVEEMEKIGVDFYKVLSWDIESHDYINRLCSFEKPVFVSTGTSSVKQLDSLHSQCPNLLVKLIHTQLEFEIENVNLKAINFLKDRYPFDVAFGNHCEDIEVLYTSIAFKPSDIFFYVKSDWKEEHIDEKHSVKLSEVGKLVNDLKKLPKSLGVAEKFEVKIKDKYLIQNVKDEK